ncbi:hypothetical protein QR680_008340 [Steinernema hermaphroditum]|uniref:DNA topoisomerase (ATP-hydrolyzing) n=1 Tax=Steinernema hermaphroditum TaxID=289476 RepID=A0AA39IIA6_9BILA|nr:hypothetical protein QR680_008340 [Steinernema hermaphroditum]
MITTSPLVNQHRDAILGLIESVIFEFIELLQNGEELCLCTILPDGRTHSIKLTFKNRERFALIIKALSLIHYKLTTNSMATRRDVFYEQKRLYGSQRTFDAAVTSICRLLNCTRRDLNLHQQRTTNWKTAFRGRKQLRTRRDQHRRTLLYEDFRRRFPDALLVTGRGYPDICTRHVLRRIIEITRVPCFCLTDADPHGIAIFMTYKYGAETPSAVNENCFVPDIIWLGMRPSDAKRLPIGGDQFLRLQPGDKKRLNGLLGRALTLSEHTVVEELQLMVREDFKLELEAISGISARYMTSVYIPQCLKRLGYRYL